jgi:hypothetical protein
MIPIEKLAATSARFIGAMVIAAAQSLGCGIDWGLPDNHFEGVDEFGFVSQWAKLGEVDCGDGFVLPIHLNFNSNRKSTSPYLGRGWSLSLLESNVVQTSENEFKLTQPEGRYRFFWRNRAQPTVLDGQGGWKAEINGETIIAWAECGWKLTYQRGKLTSMATPKNRRFDFVYADGCVSQIREGGVTRLSVEANTSPGKGKTLIFNDKRLEIALKDSPQVEVVNGRRIIAGLAASLSGVSGQKERSEEYEFGVNDALQPTLKTTVLGKGEHFYVWDPETKRISGDGPIKYEITPGKKPRDNVAVSRKVPGSSEEFWYEDEAGGTETSQGSDGVRRVTQRFTSGLLSGRIRSIKERMPGASEFIALYAASYDQSGRLLRVVDDDKDSLSVDYEPTSTTATIVTEGKSVRLHFEVKGATWSAKVETADRPAVDYILDPKTGALTISEGRK